MFTHLSLTLSCKNKKHSDLETNNFTPKIGKWKCEKTLDFRDNLDGEMIEKLFFKIQSLHNAKENAQKPEVDEVVFDLCNILLKSAETTFGLTNFFVDTPPEEITAVEGQSVFLKYELLTNCSMVIYKRNDIIIGNTSNIRVTESRRLKTLQIKDITQKDEGPYCLEAAGMTSKPTIVIVKRMLLNLL
ncbi:Hypothetical predicted protein [Mytilus galloprovincialis]|uniref:Immunoglobulin I-set domain-containing protein n=1 Tax=Mytilus galloprovincialis TaxID=29158 RepID=A0A8B6HII7_MYTGA|nr:Hypothetical predicted protein [Mytilus galloprovincialis]